jgi:GldL N-terminal domain
MIAEVIDANLDRIKSDLADQGLTYDKLQDDILDHVCCMLEEEMFDGNDFESSYKHVFSSMGEGTLKNLQHETIMLLDKKFQKMKNTSYLIGLSGSILTLIGAFFKMMHWPGASVVLLLGFLLVTFVFLPFYFVLSYKEQTEKPKLIFPIIGYLTLTFILIGAIFKIMHWPGANIIIVISLGIVIVGFVPLYTVQIFKKTSGRKTNIAYIVMLMIGISIIVILSRVNISKYAIDGLTESTIQNIESVDNLNNEIHNIIEIKGDTLITPEVRKVMQYSDELVSMADKMLSGLLATVNEEGKPINEVYGRDYRRASNSAYLKNELSAEFLQLSQEYKDYLLEVVKNPIVINQIEHDFRFADQNWVTGWNPKDYAWEPLIVSYEKISEFKRAVVYAEYLSVRDLVDE